MPRQPDGTSGYTIPEITHGVTVYLNQAWYMLYHVSFWAGPVLFFAAALIDFYKDPFERWRK